MDEPTASVDEENTRIIEDIISNMKKEGRSIVIITTHDGAQAERLTARILLMQEGKIVRR
jgi:ABC-type multidrug transport system ATPase subunit